MISEKPTVETITLQDLIDRCNIAVQEMAPRNRHRLLLLNVGRALVSLGEKVEELTREIAQLKAQMEEKATTIVLH